MGDCRGVKEADNMRFGLICSSIGALLSMMMGDVAPTVFFMGWTIIAAMVVLHEGG